MCPIILLTGEDLGLKPSSVEQAKFEYSPLDKIFNKGLDKDEDKKEGLLKRLKNIENKIKSENKESIKNEEQLEAMKGQSTMADNKPKKIVLLKDRLGNIFDNFDSNFNNTGKSFLKTFQKMKKRLIMIICFLK